MHISRESLSYYLVIPLILVIEHVVIHNCYNHAHVHYLRESYALIVIFWLQICLWLSLNFLQFDDEGGECLIKMHMEYWRAKMLKWKIEGRKCWNEESVVCYNVLSLSKIKNYSILICHHQKGEDCWKYYFDDKNQVSFVCLCKFVDMI